MSAETVKTPLDNAVWTAWIQKGKKADQATNRKVLIAGVIIVVLYAIGATLYLSVKG